MKLITKAICWLIGHDVHLRIHKPRGDDHIESKLQAVCERCMESFGTRTASFFEPKSRTEAWLVKVLPERTKKRMYKKATELYG